MGENKIWKEPGTLRPLNDPVAKTPLREKYDELVEIARMMMERPDGLTVIYLKMKEINQRGMRPVEAEIWQAAEAKDFKKIRQQAEVLLDEDPQYGWAYFYLVMVACRAENLLALSKYAAVPDGPLVCQEETEEWHEARRSYKRAQRFADESLHNAFRFMEDINKSLQLCREAESALKKQKYETALMLCAQMPVMNFNDSEKLVDQSIHALFKQCKQAEFKRRKELGRDLGQEVKDRYPEEYSTWTYKNEQTIAAYLDRHGAKKPTFWLALISLIFSCSSLLFGTAPFSLFFLGFAWETTRDEFHFFRGILEAVGLSFVVFLIGEPLGIFPDLVYYLIVKVANVLGSLWFFKCGITALKFNKLYDDLIPYSNRVIRPINDGIREELAAEYAMVPEAEGQLAEWSKWYQW